MMVFLNIDWIPNYDAELFPRRQNQSLKYLALALENIIHIGHWPRPLASPQLGQQASGIFLFRLFMYRVGMLPAKTDGPSRAESFLLMGRGGLGCAPFCLGFR